SSATNPPPPWRNTTGGPSPTRNTVWLRPPGSRTISSVSVVTAMSAPRRPGGGHGPLGGRVLRAPVIFPPPGLLAGARHHLRREQVRVMEDRLPRHVPVVEHAHEVADVERVGQLGQAIDDRVGAAGDDVAALDDVLPGQVWILHLGRRLHLASHALEHRLD